MKHTDYVGDMFIHPERPRAVVVEPGRMSAWKLAESTPRGDVSWRADVEGPAAAASADWLALVTPWEGLTSALELYDWDELAPQHRRSSRRVAEWLSLTFTPEGKELLATGIEGELDILDVPSLETVATTPLPEFTSVLGFAPDGETVVGLTSHQGGGHLTRYRYTDGRLVEEGRYDLSGLTWTFSDCSGAVAFDGSGRTFVFLSSETDPHGLDFGGVFAFDTHNGQRLWARDLSDDSPERFGPTDRAHRSTPAVADGTVHVGTIDGRIVGLSAETGRPVAATRLGDTPIHHVKPERPGHLLAVAGEELVSVPVGTGDGGGPAD